MRSSGAFLIGVLIILGMMLSEFSIDPSDARGAGQSPVVSPRATDPLALADRPVRSRNRFDRKQDRPRGKDERIRQDEVLGDTLCAFVIQLPGGDLCTHGPDPAPPGFDEDEQVEPLSARAASRETALLACDGDGQSGYRVQVLYVYGSDVASRHAQLLPSIQGWAGTADQIFQTSAGETGGSRSLRYVHDGSCQPLVEEVVVSPAGDGSFGTTLSELRAKGYNRTDRIYLMFVDTTAAGICGIGTIKPDDKPGAANRNNTGPSYARVDAGCWSGSVAAHEVMHNLGGVQDSAPNSSQSGHCIDEYDVMCYSDSPFFPAMRIDCPERSRNSTRFDCGHQDYFHTNPAPGSYLANFWNAAENRFLIAGADGPVDPTPPPPPPDDDNAQPSEDDSNPSTGNDQNKKKDKHKNGKHKKGKHKNGKHNKH